MTERLQRVLKDAKGLQVVFDDKNLSVVDPTEMVDGSPSELLTLDLSQEQPLDKFMLLVIIPILTAQGYDAKKILNLPDGFDDDTPGQGAA
jgi:hypothetical protein